MPIRLLECKSAKLGIIKYVDGNKKNYFCVSHVWNKNKTMINCNIGSWEIDGSWKEKLILCGRIGEEIKKDFFWMDSLCIIQSSEQELQKEIPNMKEIYTKSDNTIALINHNLTDEEIETIHALCKKYHENIENKSNIQSQMSILTKILDFLKKGNIFNSEWFTRVWIIQECIVSNNIVIVNNNLIGLSMVNIFFLIQHALENETLRNIIFEIPQIVAELINNNIRLKIHKNNININNLLSLTQKRNCTKQEDKIYGIMGLVNVSLKVEYGTDVNTLFLKFIESITKNGDHSWLLLHNNNKSIIPNFKEKHYNIDYMHMNKYGDKGYSPSLKLYFINSDLIIKMQICLVAEIEFVFILTGSTFHQLQEVINLFSSVFIDWLDKLIELIYPHKDNKKYDNKTYVEAAQILLDVEKNDTYAIKKSVNNIILKELFAEMQVFTKPLALSKIKVYNTEKFYYVLIHGSATISQKIFMTDYYINKYVLYYVGNINNGTIIRNGSFIYKKINDNIKSQIVQIL